MLSTLFAALTLLPLIAPFQGADANPASKPTSADPLEYGIQIRTSYAMPGDVIEVAWSIQVKEDCMALPSALTGGAIALYVGEKSLGPIRSAPTEESEMEFKKGTSFQGKMPIAVNELIRKSGLKLDKTTTLNLSLGLGPVARANVKVVPDMSDYPLDKLDLSKTKVVILTDFGSMVARFFPGKAPNHVKRFVGLAQKHFYDGIQFHRIVPGFMIQGGDYHTRAAGSPSDMGAQPPLKSEFNDIKHVKGILSMARTNDPNSASAQFFVMHGRAPYLDGNYTVFGKVIEGLDVIDALARQPIGRSSTGEMSKPLKPVWIRKMIVLGVPKK